MAKPTRNATSRIAATINARYYPSSGATDTFYLDGRISGRREHRAADITLDREDRGFFYSVFAHLGSQQADELSAGRLRKSLDRILLDVKQHGRNIDAEINELAECAVEIAGRMTLKHEGVKQPYFAGIIVKDSEIAAITMGSGCAYLYRGDVLYPLTTDDYPLEAIDLNGRNVPGHDVYCAGVAGTVRYSNIAQMQEDDCLIVCNKEVMEALGQREVLRLLYEAEDQADAAGLIVKAAAAKLPGSALQFMIGFVEAINTMEKTGRLPFGRGLTDTAAVMAGRAGIGAAADKGHLGHAAADRAAAVGVSAGTAGATESYADIAEETFDQGSSNDVLSEYGNKSEADSSEYPLTNEDEYDIHEDDYYEDDYHDSGRIRRIAFYLILGAICVICLFAIWQMIFGKDKEPELTTTTTPAISTSGSTSSQPAATTTESQASTDPTTDASSEPTTESTTTESTTAATTTESTTTAATTASGELIATHTVQAGDTLWNIATNYYGNENVQESIDLIVSYNNLTTENVQIGQNLKIPVKN